MDYEDLADVIVVGGGAAGMIAARNLARIGSRVLLLEARERLGGRISTRQNGSSAVELGAGFVHGDNETLWELVQDSGTQTEESNGTQWVAEPEGLVRRDDLWDKLGAVFQQVDAENYSSFGRWMKSAPTHAAPQDLALAREFVENFHAGPAESVSAATLRETKGGTEDSQHVVKNGYSHVVATLEQGCYAAGVEVLLRTAVQKIDWEPGAAMVTVQEEGASEPRKFGAKAVIITVPLGFLKAGPEEEGFIRFSPDLTEKRRVWQQLPFGDALRVSLTFRRTFWDEAILPEKLREEQGKNFGFVHRPGSPIPVWWSNSPEPMLIGWAGGPAAKALSGKSEKDLVQLALHELAKFSGCEISALQQALVRSDWHDWRADPYARGGYSFSVAGQEDSPARLRLSIEDTLFFAGEATAEVAELGTVGGALSSGERVAREVRRTVLIEPGMLSSKIKR